MKIRNEEENKKAVPDMFPLDERVKKGFLKSSIINWILAIAGTKIYRLIQQNNPYHIEITLIPSKILSSGSSFSFSQYWEMLLKLLTMLNTLKISYFDSFFSYYSSSSIFASSSYQWGDESSSNLSCSAESIVKGFVESLPLESLLKLNSLERFLLFSYYTTSYFILTSVLYQS